MSIYRKFKQTTLTIFCLATLVPALVNAAPLTKQEEKLQEAATEFGLQSDTLSIAQENLSAAANNITSGVYLAGRSTSGSFSGRMSSDTLLGSSTDAVESGLASMPLWSHYDGVGPVTSLVRGINLVPGVDSIAGVNTLGTQTTPFFDGTSSSVVQVATDYGPLVFQPAPGMGLAEQIAEVRKQIQASVMSPGMQSANTTSGTLMDGAVFDMAIKHSTPTATYVATGVSDSNGQINPKAAKFLSNIKVKPGDSLILVGSASDTALAATQIMKQNGPDTLSASQVKFVTPAAPPSFAPTPLELQMGRESGDISADTEGESVVFSSSATSKHIVIAQVVHQAGPQDLAGATPAAVLAGQNN